jgi:polyisoprenoid-binding protein YceI
VGFSGRDLHQSADTIRRGSINGDDDMTTTTLPTTPQLVPAGAWRVDPTRSAIAFALRHLMVATVQGRFTRFEGAVASRAWGTEIRGVVDAASVETGNHTRDERLREPEFLDAVAHPEIRFVSWGILPVRTDEVRVNGDLTIAGITRRLQLAAFIDRDGEPDRVTITARGSVRRSDFGIDSKGLLEAGVSDRVALTIHVSLVKDDSQAT